MKANGYLKYKDFKKIFIRLKKNEVFSVGNYLYFYLFTRSMATNGSLKTSNVVCQHKINNTQPETNQN